MMTSLALVLLVSSWSLVPISSTELTHSSIDAHDCGDYPDLDQDRIKPIVVHYREMPTLCKWNGWTVIQSRGQFSWFPKDYFSTKLWEDYRIGFGVPGDEFWLGLDNIYELTQMKNYTLRITMERFDGVIRTAFFTNFKLLDNIYYTLNINAYYGDAGDALTIQHKGQKFSTIDRDNDENSGSCSLKFKGAWWYRNCHTANLNGYNYGSDFAEAIGDGIYWKGLVEKAGSLARVEMAIKEL